MDEKIDFVIPWVDGSDSNWLKEKKKYSIQKNADGSIFRYRDFGLLKYWFRGIEKFAPWVHKIYFITWGHIPSWLDTSHPKLKIIKHTDYIPKEYLPTFSANTIENNIFRISGLSEHFVYFNDDTYLIKEVLPTDFFKNGKPLDTPALNVHCPKKSLISQYFPINDVSIINEHFDFKRSIKKSWKKWYSLKNGTKLLRTIVLTSCPRFPGFWQHHLAGSFCKSVMKEVWEKEHDILHNTCLHKFRETSDVNQWLFKEWQLASGNFVVRNEKFGKSFYIDRDGFDKVHNKVTSYISRQKGKIISINDGEMSDKEFKQLIIELTNAFEKILPSKSSFEK